MWPFNKLEVSKAVDPKQIRVAFVDDENPEYDSFFQEGGYDVTHISEVKNLNCLSDGRYQIIFLDIRGVGTSLGMDGIDILEHLKKKNPLLKIIVCSGARFDSREAKRINLQADDIIPKDAPVTSYLELIDDTASDISLEKYLESLGSFNIELNAGKVIKLSSDTDRLAKYIGKKALNSKLSQDSKLTTIANIASIISNILSVG